MSKSTIRIVGAGQCGLTLALDLLRTGDYAVQVLSATTPTQLREGRPTSTQVVHGPALAVEESVGMNHWDGQVPDIGLLHMRVAAPGAPRDQALDIVGRLASPSRSVDQRVKFARVLEQLEDHPDADVRYGAVTPADLDDPDDAADLTVVAAGRGDLAAMFPVNAERSPFRAPQRHLAAFYVNGMGRDAVEPGDGVRAGGFLLQPGMGEMLFLPALSVTGQCDILFVEAVPGGPFDVFGSPDGRRLTQQEALDRAVRLVQEYAPSDLAARCTALTPTDELGFLIGAVTPTVRDGVAVLPSGTAVLGAADTVLTNDPLTAQGANNAVKCARTYADAIVERGSGPFDRGWMRQTFERFWAGCGAASTAFTNGLLMPPPPHVVQVLGAASQFPEVADRVAAGFADPNALTDWFLNPQGAADYLQQVVARHQPSGSAQ